MRKETWAFCSFCLLVLICTIPLIMCIVPDASANAAPWSTSIQIPVIVNIYNNSITEAQLKNSIEEANKLLKQADMKLVVVKPVNNPPGAGNGDDGNGEFTKDEREAMRTFGGKEIGKFKNKTGIKLSFGQKPKAEKASVVGVSQAPDAAEPPNGKPGDPTIILKYTDDADTGNTIAHELGHVMGIKGDYDNPDRIMDAQGRGSKFSREEIDQMKKFKYKFGKCSTQWEKEFPATKDEKQYGTITDDRADQGNPVSSIYDLHQVYLTSVDGSASIDAEIDVAGVLPNSEEINATYSLGFDIDDNAATGVSHAGLPGVDRIVYIHATGRIDLGTFGVSGEVYHTIAGTTLPLPQPPEAFSVNEIADFESESEPRATDFFFAIPKALLDLTAVEIPVVTTAGENGLVHDTAEFEFDLERWLKDATFITFGTGVPNPGDYYPIQISGLMPNDRFDLYLDDVLMFSDTLDGSGGFSGGFVFPPSFSNYEPHFLTAQDSTGEFAYGMTCPKAPPTGGGIVEPLVIGPQSVRTPWPIIAGGAMAIVLAISTGGWYLRKRWLRA